ncbi:hypothetical protein THIOSC15_30005 [uncultured Thiomicrorhabdus sp.]
MNLSRWGFVMVDSFVFGYVDIEEEQESSEEDWITIGEQEKDDE